MEADRTVSYPKPATRVVSLVPSITEALASVRREAVVGATDWCTHPADLDTTLEARVRGTKNPNLETIRALRPDVVIANHEENRELDVRRLGESGVEVHVTRVESVPEAVQTYERLFDVVLGWERPEWLAEVRDLWCGPLPEVTRTVAIPVWRDPWMVVGGRTFTGDLARRLGWATYADTDAPDTAAAARYPGTTPEEVLGRGVELVLLPDEPYVFTADDGPESFPGTETRLVSGRLLTWYGPSLLEARSLLRPAP